MLFKFSRRFSVKTSAASSSDVLHNLSHSCSLLPSPLELPTSGAVRFMSLNVDSPYLVLPERGNFAVSVALELEKLLINDCSIVRMSRLLFITSPSRLLVLAWVFSTADSLCEFFFSISWTNFHPISCVIKIYITT